MPVPSQGSPRPSRPRSGRPVVMPTDPTPLAARGFRAWPRSAWLHVTARTVPVLQHTRAELVGRLRAAQIPADVSRVSRWESGQHPVPPSATAVYESETGMPPSRLLAVARSLARSSGQGEERACLDQVPPPADDVVDDILERAGRPEARVSGAEWLALAVAVCGFDHFYMPPPTWQQVCDRLVSELARTRGVDHHRRHEACVTLLDHPVAQPHLLRSAGRWLTRRDVQVVTPVVSLLAEVDGPAASDVVLKLLRSSSRRLRAGTLGVVTTKLARGHLDGAAQHELEALCARRLARTTSTSEALSTLDLATHLPESSFDRLLSAMRHTGTRESVLRAREHASLVPVQTARGIGKRVGWAAQLAVVGGSRTTPEPDLMLDRLVQEALFHVHGWRRALAGRTLGASPYADLVADRALQLVEDDNKVVGLRAWGLLGSLGHGGRTHELLERTLAATDPERQREALYALSLSPRPLTHTEAGSLVDLAARATEPDVRYGAALTLGMTAPRHLDAVGDLDRASQRAVAWWHAAGPVLRDDDTTGAAGSAA